ncbi:MAG: hypothetical protein BroJett038_33170 [Chloroflexota bacterium]|nr:MAG: hypothetical protein BroJett038_33170 [Chloroflexota bacterium]
MYVPSKSVLAEPLFVGNGFEEAELCALLRHAKNGIRIMDVGANIGLYTTTLAKTIGPGGRVWSFEPFPAIAAYLNKNIEANSLSNVTIVQSAVADAQGKAKFHVYPFGSDVYNSLGASYRPVENIRADSTIVVDVTTLDSFANINGIEKIDMLKIDVEGAEERVLRGAEQLLHRSDRLMVLAELGVDSARQCGCSVPRTIEMMANWGFGTFRLGVNMCFVKVEQFPDEGGYAFFIKDAYITHLKNAGGLTSLKF